MKLILQNRISKLFYCAILFLFLLPVGTTIQAETKNVNLPSGFVYLDEIDPSISLDMRYFGDHNFVGRRIEGYKAQRCILTKEAASALSDVQKELKEFSMALKIYDCYRPQAAADDFLAWSKDLSDLKMKKEFYPKLDKKTIYDRGFIATKSGHSRGSAVDLTIVSLPEQKQEEYLSGQKLKECQLAQKKRFKDNSIDMGTGYDCFDSLANTANPDIGSEQKRNRLLLRSLMEKHGFKNAWGEWWHFKLVNEPFPDTYYNFEVE